MDIASVSSLSTALTQSKPGDATGTEDIKQALRLEQRQATERDTAIQTQDTASSRYNNPANLGNSIDVRA